MCSERSTHTPFVLRVTFIHTSAHSTCRTIRTRHCSEIKVMISAHAWVHRFRHTNILRTHTNTHRYRRRRTPVLHPTEQRVRGHRSAPGDQHARWVHRFRHTNILRTRTHIDTHTHIDVEGHPSYIPQSSEFEVIEVRREISTQHIELCAVLEATIQDTLRGIGAKFV
jgi:hypothetical protein